MNGRGLRVGYGTVIYFLLGLCTVVSEESTNEPRCRNVAYHVQNLHQCCNNDTTINGGNALEDLKTQVAGLQSQLQRLLEVSSRTDKDEYFVDFCEPANTKSMNFHVLNAMGDKKWPLDNFCQAVSSSTATAGDYDVSISLYNFKGNSDGNKNYGHPGILFNAIDTLNYEYVYFRPHSSSGCYQKGYMLNGEVKILDSSYCPDGLFVGKTWTDIKVMVRSDCAYILMRDRLVTILELQYQSLNRGGALTCNGYKNLVFFKDYKVSKPPVVPQLPPNLIKSCRKGTGWMDRSSVVLNGDGGSWPAAGFCRVQLASDIPDSASKYQLTTRLYNIRSNSGANMGHPGVMYNVQDIDNFDFVYFRPHSTSVCYQTGYVKDGAVHTVSSSTCPDGPPTSRNGFKVNVKVHSNRDVQIYKNDKHVVTVDPHFPVKPAGGVACCNGYNNVVQASSFSIDAL